MPKVLNLLFLGTGQNQDKVKLNLTELNDAILVDKDQSVHMEDGPGAKGGTKNPMMGTYHFSAAYNAETGVITPTKSVKNLTLRKEEQSVKALPSKALKATSLGGTVRGTGYQDSITEGLQVIDLVVNGDPEIKQGIKPIVINMAGFSRGAVSMLRLSNEVAARYPDVKIEINIFSMDPVPGPGHSTDRKATYVPSIVKNLVVTSMQDEFRPGFAPLDSAKLIIQDKTKTKVSQRIYRGDHGFATRLPQNEALEASARLLSDDFHRFLRQNGTKLKDDKALPFITKKKEMAEDGYFDHVISNDKKEITIEERLKLYHDMMLHADAYKEHGEKASPGFKNRRDFVDYKESYMLHGKQTQGQGKKEKTTYFFQDRDHLLSFKSVYPAFFDYYFQRNLDGAKSDDVLAEMKKMQKDDPGLVSLLRNNQVEDVDAVVKDPRYLGVPKGVYLSANAIYLGKDLLQVKEQFPHFFNYFFQKNIEQSPPSQVLTELAEIKQNPDLMRMLSMAGLPNLNRVFVLPPPRGNPNAVQEIKKAQELFELHEAVVSVCQSVLNEVDKSVDKKFAKEILERSATWLQAKGSNEEKLKWLKSDISLFIQRSPDSLFSTKLNMTLKHPNETPNFADRVVSQLRQYKISAESPLRQQLHESLITSLGSLSAAGLGNDGAAIRELLASTLQVSGVVLREDFARRETKFDKLLRSELRHIPNQTTPVTPVGEEIVKQYKSKYFEPSDAKDVRNVKQDLVSLDKIAKSVSEDHRSLRRSINLSGLFSARKSPESTRREKVEEDKEEKQNQAWKPATVPRKGPGPS